MMFGVVVTTFFGIYWQRQRNIRQLLVHTDTTSELQRLFNSIAEQQQSNAAHGSAEHTQ